MKIINVANPSTPSLIGSSYAYGSSDIAVSGNLVFLASADTMQGLGGIYVMEVSVPSDSRVLANINGTNGAAGVSADGNLAVVTDGTTAMRLFNIGDPSSPEEIGILGDKKVSAVAMVGQYTYALIIVPGNPVHTDLAVVDWSIPSNPVIIGQVTVAGGSHIEVEGTRAYVAAGTAGLQIIDISNPYTPQVRSTLDTPGTAHCVAVANSYAYVADGTAIKVVNIANSSSPYVVGSLATSATAVAVENDRLYALDGQNMKIINVANPSTPSLIGSSYAYNAEGIAVSGNLVFLATPTITHNDPYFEGGIHVLDVSNASQPQLVDYIVVPGLIRKLHKVNNFVYAGDSVSAVDIIQVSP
jgi:hypothetical protein